MGCFKCYTPLSCEGMRCLPALECQTKGCCRAPRGLELPMLAHLTARSYVAESEIASGGDGDGDGNDDDGDD
eukprot:scaffold140861_cov15-Tisochrysis_lutea.AAC.1